MRLTRWAIVLILVLTGYNAVTAQELTREQPSKRCVEAKKDAEHPTAFTDDAMVPLRAVRGDLNADGRDETVVLARYTGRGKPRPDEVLVYLETEGGRGLIAKFSAGRVGEYVLSIKALESVFVVENGLLVLQLAVLNPKSAEPPSEFVTLQFRLNGGRLEEIERSVPRFLPEHMREKG